MPREKARLQRACGWRKWVDACVPGEKAAPHYVTVAHLLFV